MSWRFAQILDRGTVGGAERHTWLLARALARVGHEVRLLLPPGPLWDQIRAVPSPAGLELEEQPALAGSPLTLARWLAGWERRRGGGWVVHSHLARADAGAALARAVFGLRAPIVTTIHSRFRTDLPWRSEPLKRALYYPVLRWAFHRMDVVFAVSRATAEQTQRHFALPADRVVPLQNAIDLELLGHPVSREEARSLLGRPAPAGPVVTSVGTLTRRKGQHLLLEAVARLAGVRPEVWLVGQGPEEANLRRRADQLGLGDRVVLFGRRDDVPLILRASDLYAQPSIHDPLPRSLLEAIAVGLPAIASAVDGIPELLVHGESAWLVPPGDVDGLHRALEAALADPARMRRVAERGSATVRARCSMDGMAEVIVRELDRRLAVAGRPVLGGSPAAPGRA